MGEKSRRRNTSALRGPVSREVLDRYSVKDPIGYWELREALSREAQKRQRKLKEAA